jgi:thiol-disulfide isomerase/thioredoxin
VAFELLLAYLLGLNDDQLMKLLTQLLLANAAAALHLLPTPVRSHRLATPRHRTVPPRMLTQLADEAEYRELVANTRGSDRVVMVEFAGAKCRACHKMAPKLAQLDRGWPGVDFYQILVEENVDFFKSIGVERAPSFQIVSGQAGTGEELFACGPSKIPLIREKLLQHGSHRQSHQRLRRFGARLSGWWCRIPSLGASA